jgi:hypothetical protein
MNRATFVVDVKGWITPDLRRGCHWMEKKSASMYWEIRHQLLTQLPSLQL